MYATCKEGRRRNQRILTDPNWSPSAFYTQLFSLFFSVCLTGTSPLFILYTEPHYSSAHTTSFPNSFNNNFLQFIQTNKREMRFSHTHHQQNKSLIFVQLPVKTPSSSSSSSSFMDSIISAATSLAAGVYHHHLPFAISHSSCLILPQHPSFSRSSSSSRCRLRFSDRVVHHRRRSAAHPSATAQVANSVPVTISLLRRCLVLLLNA